MRSFESLNQHVWRNKSNRRHWWRRIKSPVHHCGSYCCPKEWSSLSRMQKHAPVQVTSHCLPLPGLWPHDVAPPALLHGKNQYCTSAVRNGCTTELSARYLNEAQRARIDCRPAHEPQGEARRERLNGGTLVKAMLRVAQRAGLKTLPHYEELLHPRLRPVCSGWRLYNHLLQATIFSHKLLLLSFSLQDLHH